MAANLHSQGSRGPRAAAMPPLSLPSFEHLFSGGPVVLAASVAAADKPAGQGDAAGRHADDKLAGSGDSAGRATAVKAPGGRDARNSRDGG